MFKMKKKRVTKVQYSMMKTRQDKPKGTDKTKDISLQGGKPNKSPALVRKPEI